MVFEAKGMKFGTKLKNRGFWDNWKKDQEVSGTLTFNYIFFIHPYHPLLELPDRPCRHQPLESSHVHAKSALPTMASMLVGDLLNQFLQANNKNKMILTLSTYKFFSFLHLCQTSPPFFLHVELLFLKLLMLFPVVWTLLETQNCLACFVLSNYALIILCTFLIGSYSWKLLTVIALWSKLQGFEEFLAKTSEPLVDMHMFSRDIIITEYVNIF